nr:DUF423 domain-containing protein [Jiella sp. LLJ827]
MLGAAGVGGAALAAHGGENRLVAIAAALALVHAPALVALAALVLHAPRLIGLAGFGIVVGVALFSGDLATRYFTGDRLFTNAAPSGGMILIAAWLLLAVTGCVIALRRKDESEWGGRT